MRNALAMIIGVIVSVAGFGYYLIFGKRNLTPSIHRNLSEERLAVLLGESFSYGEDGARFTLCAGHADRCVSLRKEIRSTDDVHLVYQPPSIDFTRPTGAGSSSERVGVSASTSAGVIDFGEDVDAAARFLRSVCRERFDQGLEDGCYCYATGVSIYGRFGWSS